MLFYICFKRKKSQHCYSGILWSSLYCGVSSLCVGLYRWLVKVSWLGKLVSVFWWVELYFFSLECNEMSSNELWDVYSFGVTLGSLYLEAQGCVPLLLENPVLKCKLAAYCYLEIPDEELLEDRSRYVYSSLWSDTISTIYQECQNSRCDSTWEYPAEWKSICL